MEKSNSGWVDELIVSYLEGKASGDDIRRLESWVMESEENKKYFAQINKVWNTSAELTISTDKALAKVLGTINRRRKHREILIIAQKIAAVLFIPLLISLFWMYSVGEFKSSKSTATLQKVVAAFGTFSELTLPDGSKVWLNAGSTLVYPDKFSNENRLVYLTGEAYFEVQSNENIPFFVSTPFFTVKATGTRFNIRAEKDYQKPSVTLIEGKVAVQKNSPDNKGELITRLQPNHHMTYNTINGSFSVTTEDPYKYFAWKDGKLVFRNDNISEVARRISLQYNVDIEIRGDQIKKYRYRATFDGEPLSELLRLLKISSPVDYTEVKPTALPDGTFTRRKIIIYSLID